MTIGKHDCDGGSVAEAETIEYLTTKQVCKQLGLGRTKVNELCHDGRLEAKKFDGATRINANSVREFVRSAKPWGKL